MLIHNHMCKTHCSTQKPQHPPLLTRYGCGICICISKYLSMHQVTVVSWIYRLLNSAVLLCVCVLMCVCVRVGTPAAGCHYLCLCVLYSTLLLAFCKCLWSQGLFPRALLSSHKFNVLHTKLSLAQNAQTPHQSMSWQFFLIKNTHTGKGWLWLNWYLKWNPSSVSQLSKKSRTGFMSCVRRKMFSFWQRCLWHWETLNGLLGIVNT